MSDITLQEALQEYLDHLKIEGKSASTLYTYGKDAEQIGTHFGPEKKLSAILVPHVAGFLKSDALLKLPGGKDRSAPTVKKTVRVFRMFLVWSLGKGYISKLPFPKNMTTGQRILQNPEANHDGSTPD